MSTFALGAAVGVFCLGICAGCATRPSLAPISAHGSAKLAQRGADVLADAVRYTRASGREVAGWCWNDKGTGGLAYLAQASVGGYEGVGVALPIDPQGDHYLSCSWHTHGWGPDVAPGPSRQDLRTSMLPGARDISHFVLDRHGIWHYADGHRIEMCPWNSTGTNIDPTRCRTRFAEPKTPQMRVSRYYGARG